MSIFLKVFSLAVVIGIIHSIGSSMGRVLVGIKC